MNNHFLYNKYSTYLKKKYGTKVYKLPVNIDASCPNRDGTISKGGCYFCSSLGAGFESLENTRSVKEQLCQNMSYIGKRYKAEKFIAYFQNYTNTHMPLERFENYIKEACIDNIVEIDISTRPDCISVPYLEVLKKYGLKHNINITIELGLQTTNDETLVKVNRGHTVEDYVQAVKMINSYNFDICTHLILNLPWDDDNEVINMANLMNKLNMQQVKLHALYIAKNTVFEKLFLENKINICSRENYEKRVIMFLENLNSNTVVQRLIGRAPKEETIFCNWNTSWWKIKESIENKMKDKLTYQGRIYKI